MRIAVITSQEYNDIDTYSTELIEALNQWCANKDSVVRFDVGKSLETKANYINKGSLEDISNTAKLINSTFDACLLQHHTSLFAGYSGDLVLAFAKQINIPLYTFYHDLKSNPDKKERNVVNRLAFLSKAVFAFSKISIEFLEHYYKLNRDHIKRTEYAIPLFEELDKPSLLNKLDISASGLIVSCGELNDDYGFKTIVNSLPSIVQRLGDARLLILYSGKDDADYINSYYRIANKRKVGQNLIVKHIDELDMGLHQVINAADVYVSANIDSKQLNNMFLTKAVGAGALVISSSTWVAKELTEDRKGELFSIKSSSELSKVLIDVLNNADVKQELRSNASLYGSQNSWVVIGKQLLEVIEKDRLGKGGDSNERGIIESLPVLNLKHLNSLMVEPGILMESNFGINDLSKGYRLDACAMAIRVFAKAFVYGKDDYLIGNVKKLVALVNYMLPDNSNWCSHMHFDRSMTNELDELALGKTVWAMAELYACSEFSEIKEIAYKIFTSILTSDRLMSIQAKAYGLIGLTHFLKVERTNTDLIDLFQAWTKDLERLFPADPYKSWQWYQDEIPGEMAVVPLALLNAASLTSNKETLSIGKRAIRFLEKHVTIEGYYSPKIIGLSSTNTEVKNPEVYAEEAYLLAAAYYQLWVISKEERYMTKLNTIHSWYLGENTLGKSLYDSKDGACYKGFSGRTVMPAKNIYSTAAYWLSYFDVLSAHIEGV